MGSTVVNIPDEDIVNPVNVERKKAKFSLVPIICFLREKKNNDEMRKWIHSIKVGVALILVSLPYFLDPLYKEFGDDNVMWAIITVVVIFEFYAGAMLGKGLNRGMGTILGGVLGYFTATLAQQVGGIGNSIIIGTALLIFCAGATYCRLTPRIKARYGYGALIFILTFSLVAVSGVRIEKVIEIARERISMIVLGFIICIFTSLFVFPIWASDELHDSTVSKFYALATCVEGCLEDYLRFSSEKESQSQPINASFSKCKSVLNSKSKDKSLVNFARWEPWHGKYGLSHPWDKYLKIGELLRELAATILSLKGCLQSSKEPMQILRESIKEPCEAVEKSVAWTLREFGESMKKMRRCEAEVLIVPKLTAVRIELSQVTSNLPQLQNTDGLAIASFVFSLIEMVEKLEELAKEVEQLGKLAYFRES